MIPSDPPRNPSYGFLYLPPYRVQGISVAGEETFVQIPELNVTFDIGRAAKLALTSDFVALSHGHMDHSAGLAYYFSQRFFQGMGMGTVLCPTAMVEPLRKLMNAWVDVESQRTPHRIVGMEPDSDSAEFELKRGFNLRAFHTDHTVASLGFAVVERRSKLKEEFAGLPQEKLVELKQQGTEITYMREVYHAAYMGDTAPGPHFDRPEVKGARILITECTFLEGDHRDRAKIGKHLHISDIKTIAENCEAEHIVLTHLSRRTHLGQARSQIENIIGNKHQHRIHILMDYRTNRARYQKQLEEAEKAEAQRD